MVSRCDIGLRTQRSPHNPENILNAQIGLSLVELCPGKITHPSPSRQSGRRGWPGPLLQSLMRGGLCILGPYKLVHSSPPWLSSMAMDGPIHMPMVSIKEDNIRIINMSNKLLLHFYKSMIWKHWQELGAKSFVLRASVSNHIFQMGCLDTSIGIWEIEDTRNNQ